MVAVIGWISLDGVDAGGRSSPNLAHWDGTTWQLTPVPVPSAHASGWLVNHVVQVGPKAVYALGKTNDDGDPDGLLAARWDGARWQPVAVPPVGEVNAAGLDGAGALWVGGWPKGQHVSVLATWNGTGWRTEQLPAELIRQGGQNTILGFARAPGTGGVLTCGLVGNDDMSKAWGLIASRG